MQTTTQPPCTFVAEVEGSGTCCIPDTFESDFQHLAASLDWARVFNTHQQHSFTAVELRAAAKAARAIADKCERFANTTDNS